MKPLEPLEPFLIRNDAFYPAFFCDQTVVLVQPVVGNAKILTGMSVPLDPPANGRLSGKPRLTLNIHVGGVVERPYNYGEANTTNPWPNATTIYWTC